MAQKFQEDQDQERLREAEKNKPNCKICFTDIEFEDIRPLDCDHIFHPQCLDSMIQSEIGSKTFPIRCPEEGCARDLFEHEIREFVGDEETFQKYLEFSLKTVFEKENQSFI